VSTYGSLGQVEWGEKKKKKRKKKKQEKEIKRM